MTRRCYRSSNRRMARARMVCAVVLSTCGILLVHGCRSIPSREATLEEVAPIVWPQAPAPTRLVYEASMYGPVDLGARLSFWNRLVNAITGSDRGREPWIRPFGVAVDEFDNLCLTDIEAGAVGFYDRKKRVFRRWQQAGEHAFIIPVGVARARDTMYVADTGLNRVLAFDDDGQLLFDLEQPFERPAGLAAAGNKLVVADSLGHRVHVFDLQGNYQYGFGKLGQEPGEFNRPTHVTMDQRGWVYVTDSMNNRVQVFDDTGQVQHIIGSIGASSGHLARPKGIAVDADGHVYVADALLDNIQVFDLEGNLLLIVGSQGGNPGEFWLPAGIAVGRDNRMYVADGYNHRVQMLRYISSP